MIREPKEFEMVDRKDFDRDVGEVLEKLLPDLKELSSDLRKRGFVVDETCRVEMDPFKEVFGEKEILEDNKRVEKAEESFLYEGVENIGELLEVVKTLAFNKYWFGKRLISLRTSKYDDYTNGIDEIILDTETQEPLAAVDTTTDVNGKAKEIVDKIKEGGEIKYGFQIKIGGTGTGGEIKKASLNGIPIFIISLNHEELLSLAQEIIENREDKNYNLRKMEIEILESLRHQSECYQEISSFLRNRYERAKIIFDDLLRDRAV